MIGIDPILPQVRFMFFDRYWYHMQLFQASTRRICGMFQTPSLPKFSKAWSSKILSLPIMICLFNDYGFVLNYLVSFGGPKVKHIFAIKLPNMAINILVFFPMVFLWFSHSPISPTLLEPMRKVFNWLLVANTIFANFGANVRQFSKQRFRLSFCGLLIPMSGSPIGVQ